YARQALDLARQTDDKHTEVLSLIELAYSKALDRNYSEAIEDLRQNIKFCEQIGFTEGLANCASYLAATLLLSNDLAEAVKAAETYSNYKSKDDQIDSPLYAIILARLGEFRLAQVKFEEPLHDSAEMDEEVNSHYSMKYVLGLSFAGLA